MHYKIVFFSVCVSAAALTACQSNGTADSDPEELTERNQVAQVESGSESRVQRQLDPIKPTTADSINPSEEIPDLSGELESEGYGLLTMIDGSSPEAFASSLQMVSADTTPEQYQRLESSLQLLEVYTLGVNDLASFYMTLDGMTGEEIIKLAQQRNQR